MILENKKKNLIIRQLKDISSQPCIILKGKNDPETIESYALYASEFKNYVRQNIPDIEILNLVDEILDIKYKRNRNAIEHSKLIY
ncbi:hypothetical protein GO491_07110 [Flavobacteriaceae bacterium Ap0902]|nr:hypothetical protein [Flavobacteriaceae bacterium Ap0902]